MVVQLPIDVVDHGLLLGVANCECTVSILPVELQLNPFFLIDVLAGVAFQLPYKIGYCLFRWYSHKYMCVIVIASDTKCIALKIVRNARHVVPNSFPKFIISQQGLSLLGAKNKVKKKLYVGCHRAIFLMNQ